MAREDYEIVIGLEVHCELSTKTKIFCSCSTEFGGEPNTHCCPICMAMPGTLPVLNEKVVEYAVKAGLATNCSIEKKSKNDKKITSIQITQNHIKYHNLINHFVMMDMLLLKQKMEKKRLSELKEFILKKMLVN